MKLRGTWKWNFNSRGPALAAGAVFLAVLMMFPHLPLFYKASEQVKYDATRPEPEMPGADTDADGLYNNLEKKAGTDPLDPDTDADGLNDGTEYRYWLGREKTELGRNMTDQWLLERYPKESHRELARRYGPGWLLACHRVPLWLPRVA